MSRNDKLLMADKRNKRQNRSHCCHVNGCGKFIGPTLLMCFEHWRKVPRLLQDAVVKEFREGQCTDKRPSKEWFLAAHAAIRHVESLDAAKQQR